jgi:hypothetical protein
MTENAPQPSERIGFLRERLAQARACWRDPEDHDGDGLNHLRQEELFSRAAHEHQQGLRECLDALAAPGVLDHERTQALELAKLVVEESIQCLWAERVRELEAFLGEAR